MDAGGMGLVPGLVRYLSDQLLWACSASTHCLSPTGTTSLTSTVIAVAVTDLSLVVAGW